MTAHDELSELRQQVESLLAANAELTHNAAEHRRLKLELSKILDHGAASPSMCDLVAITGVVVRERDQLQARIVELEKQKDDLVLRQFDHIGSGNRTVRRIKAEAVREACTEIEWVFKHRIPSTRFTDGALHALQQARLYANQIEGRE